MENYYNVRITHSISEDTVNKILKLLLKMYGKYNVNYNCVLLYKISIRWEDNLEEFLNFSKNLGKYHFLYEGHKIISDGKIVEMLE